MAFSMATLKTGVKATLAVASKHSHAVAAGISIVTMGLAVYKAIKATETVKDRLEKAEIEKNEAYLNQHNVEEITPVEPPKFEPLTTKEKVKIYAKVYWPVAALVTLSAGCMIGSVVLAERHIKAMTLLATTAEAALDQYESAAEKVLGTDGVDKIRNQVAKDAVDMNPPIDDLVPHSGHGNTLILDKLSGQYIYSSVAYIRDNVNDLNAMLADGVEFVSVNDYLEVNGFNQQADGYMRGWARCGDYAAEKIRMDVQHVTNPNDPDKSIAVVEIKTLPKEQCYY